MAEILFRAVDNASGHVMAWKRGMPVVVFENGHVWGAREVIAPADGGKFFRIRISDVTKAQVENFIRNRWGFDTCDEDQGVRRRHIDLRVSDLPAQVRQQLNQTGFFETTWPQVRNFLRRISTQENFA